MGKSLQGIDAHDRAKSTILAGILRDEGRPAEARALVRAAAWPGA